MPTDADFSCAEMQVFSQQAAKTPKDSQNNFLLLHMEKREWA